MTTVVTAYGTFDEKALLSIRETMKTISDEMTIIEGHKANIKAEIDGLHETHKIPKKILSRMAKTYHKNSFPVEATEDSEFESLYVGMQEAK